MGLGGCFGMLLAALLCVTGSSCLEITRLSVPDFVANGSVDHVVLDCEYDYDLELDEKLVVKWFHGEDPKAVYQWIPELDSRVARKEYRADPDYNLPGERDPYTRSRALKLHLPTTEVSGKYKCEVSSLDGLDSEEKEMIVYTLPSSIVLNYTILEEVVEVSCVVRGVHPVPEMALFLIEPASVNRTDLDEGTDIDFEMEDGAYEVEFSVNISLSDLPSASDGLTFFGCEVEMDGAEYQKTVRVPYFPNPVAEKQEGDNDNDDDEDNASSHPVGKTLSVLMPILLFLFT